MLKFSYTVLFIHLHCIGALISVEAPLSQLQWLMGKWVAEFQGKLQWPTVPDMKFAEVLEVWPAPVSAASGIAFMNYTSQATELYNGDHFHDECAFITANHDGDVIFFQAGNNGFSTVEEGRVEYGSLKMRLKHISRLRIAREIPVVDLERHLTLNHEGNLEQVIFMRTTSNPTHGLLEHTRVTYKKLDSPSCFPVRFTVRETNTYVDGTWVAVAVVFGMILGFTVALVLWKIYYEKKLKGRSDFRKVLSSTLTSVVRYLRITFCPWCNREENITWDGENPSDVAYERLDTDDDDTAPNDPNFLFVDNPQTVRLVNPTDQEVQAGDGLVSILDQRSENSAVEERLKQDLLQAEKIDRGIISVRNLIAERLAQIHLMDTVEVGADRDILKDLFETLHLYILETVEEYEQEFKTDLAEIEDKNLKTGNFSNMAIELERLKTTHKRQMHNVFSESLNFFREQLKSTNVLTDEQQRAFMTKVNTSLIKLEDIIGVVLDKNTKTLEERSIQREQFAIEFYARKMDKNNELVCYADAFDELLKTESCKGISQKTKTNFLADVNVELAGLRKSQFDKFDQKHKEINKDLMTDRMKTLKNMVNAHDLKNRTNGLNKSNDVNDFLTDVEEFLVSEADRESDTLKRLDSEEFYEINSAFQTFTKSWSAELEEEAVKFLEKLKVMSNADATGFENMTGTIQSLLKEKNEQRTKDLKLKIDQSKANGVIQQQQFEKNYIMKKAERKAVLENEENIIAATLSAQSSLDADSCQEIMLQHQKNIRTLDNMLKVSVVRQEKTLQFKLAQRRRKVAELQAQEEKAQSKSVRKKLLKECKSELAKLRHEENSVGAELKLKLYKEVKLALKENDWDCAQLMAKLQVGCIRRQKEIYEKEAMIKELENALRNQKQEFNENQSQKVKELIKEHRKQLSTLHRNVTSSREMQLRQIQEKIAQRKTQEEGLLKNRFEKQQQALLSRSINGKMTATESMNAQDILESQMEREQYNLSEKLHSERERQKMDLDQSFRLDINQALMTQKSQFLHRLVSLCKLSKQDLRRTQSVESQSDTAKLGFHPHSPDDGSEENIIKESTQDSEDGPLGHLPPLHGNAAPTGQRRSSVMSKSSSTKRYGRLAPLDTPVGMEIDDSAMNDDGRRYRSSALHRSRERSSRNSTDSF